MSRKQHSIDGFVPRRPSASLGGLSKSPNGMPPVPTVGRREVGQVKEIVQPSKVIEQQSKAKGNSGLTRSEIDDSLNAIDTPDLEINKRKRRFSRLPSAHSVRRIIKWLLILILVVGVGIGAYIGIKALLAGGNIFKGNVFDIIQSRPLKMDEDGRSNILILGTSDDDPGHEGAYLTDSMMILSVDQNRKNAYMISIPRDLYVEFGQACPGGYRSKINEYFNCIGGDPTDIEKTRTALAKEGEFIGEIFGMDIQYGVNLNYTVMRDLVNAVGGSITIKIESEDPRGQMDSNFDWKCGATWSQRQKNCPPNGHFIDYPNGEVELDAEHALYLAQARGAGGVTYGFPASNFDREKNQQKIIKALREKAVSAGVVTDFGKVVGIIDALGNNLRTTFETSEVRTLMTLAQEIKSENIRSISLNDPENPMMINGNAGGASIVHPAAGLFEYDELQEYIQQELSANPVTREKANITVLNGSDVPGAAQQFADKLEEQGFVIDDVGNAPDGDYGKIKIYDLDKNKPATAAKLKELYGTEILTTPPPVTVTGDTSFVIIVGTIAKDTAGQSDQ